MRDGDDGEARAPPTRSGEWPIVGGDIHRRCGQSDYFRTGFRDRTAGELHYWRALSSGLNKGFVR